MTNNTLYRAMMRPLSISMLDETKLVNASQEPGDIALRLIGGMVGDVDNPLDVARSRYKEASEGCNEPMIVPMHPTIMDHVVRPLVEAKQCYILGMPVACIAQAGLVGEMVALWRFQMLSSTVDGKPFDEKMQKLLMGRAFDKLGQQERVRVLQALDSLDDDVVQAFGGLRSLRRQYLHFMVDHSQNSDADARKALKLANILVVETLGIEFNEGKVVLPENVRRFIRDMLEPSTDELSS